MLEKEKSELEKRIEAVDERLNTVTIAATGRLDKLEMAIRLLAIDAKLETKQELIRLGFQTVS